MISRTKISYAFLHVFLILAVSITSCNDERFSTNPTDVLEFSTDTLTFDTVFTTIGSSTSKILVYNNNKYAINISEIKLSGGAPSSFKINVDGSNSTENKFKDIELRANDSMYIFVQVTVDTRNENSPVLIEDSLMFLTNGVLQKINLEAFGQDVELLKDKRILNDTTLTSTKPYLVYGNLSVDSAKTLTLAPGCRLFFHNNANLVVNGNLRAEGTAEQPITLRGDRLDKLKFETPFPYNNVAGQWGVIYLISKYGNHVLDYVNINSAYVGIYYVNEDKNTLPNLQIKNCRIHNSLLYNLVAMNGNVTVENSEISNSSSYGIYLNGGKHIFIQSTIVNYFNNSNVQPVSRDQKPAVMIMSLTKDAPMETVFMNCVISGSLSNEFTLASKYPAQYKGVFDHCYINKTDSLAYTQFSHIRWAEKTDTVFKSIKYDYYTGTYFDFMLDSVSPARGLADKDIAIQYPLDLNGNNRLKDGQPDAGAYEWQPTR